MPDITMCSGKGCPLKETCLRFKATPSKYYQSYFTKPPIEVPDSDDPICDEHWPIEKD